MKPYRRVLHVLMLTLVGLTACDRTDRVGDLSGPTTPQFNQTDDGVRILRTRTPLSSDLTFVTASPVSSGGGVMFFGAHSLEIPENAVANATHFSATIRAGEIMKIDLRAWTPSGTPVTTFNVPVKLALDLNTVADEIPDWTKVIVVYHNPNGLLEVMPSVVNPALKRVTAELKHFSDYSPGWSTNDSTSVEP